MTKEENERRLAYLKGIVLSMPEKPGTYQYYDKDHNIIYVGKAKRLKSRVSSYFHKEVDRYKTKVLVSKIWDISYSVVRRCTANWESANQAIQAKIQRSTKRRQDLSKHLRNQGSLSSHLQDQNHQQTHRKLLWSL